MRIQFQADVNLKQSIVTGVLRRVPEISFQTSPEAGLAKLSDMAVLSQAANEGRILITHYRRTMPFDFAKFIAAKVSPGVSLVPRRIPIRTIVEELILIWHASEAEDYYNRILTLPL